MGTHRDVYVSLALDHLPLKQIQEEVCARFGLSPRPELHVTLGFLGEVDDEQVIALSRELAVLSREPLPTLKIFGTGGVFEDTRASPPRLGPITHARSRSEIEGSSRVLWWVVEPSEALLRCQQTLRGALERLKISTSQQPAEFYPHITIGSCPRTWDAHDIEKTSTLGLILSPASVTVERLHVTKIELHPQSLSSIVEYGRQAGVVVWLTGWPASGKSTLARALRKRLGAAGQESLILDSDEVRAKVFPDLGYTEEDRGRFYASLTGMAGLFAGQGLVVLVPATASLRTYREEARRKIPRFIEVYLDTPREEVKARDPKGLYQQGKIDFSYEPPLAPEVTMGSAADAEGIERILKLIEDRRLGAPVSSPPGPR